MKMQQSLSVIKITAALILVAAGFVVYNLFVVKHVSAVDDTASTDTGSSLPVIVTTIENINLDSSIFTNPTLSSLQDFSVPLIAQPVGKDNPFAPGAGSSVSSQPVSPKKSSKK